MSDEERKQILQMVEDGRITADQALILIRELEQDAADGMEPQPGGESLGAASLVPVTGKLLPRAGSPRLSLSVLLHRLAASGRYRFGLALALRY
jgi:hypothetical protein